MYFYFITNTNIYLNLVVSMLLAVAVVRCWFSTLSLFYLLSLTFHNLYPQHLAYTIHHFYYFIIIIIIIIIKFVGYINQCSCSLWYSWTVQRFRKIDNGNNNNNNNNDDEQIYLTNEFGRFTKPASKKIYLNK